MANLGLYRSVRSNMIAGVMGGIAERFGWNANLLRIIFIFYSEISDNYDQFLLEQKVFIPLWRVGD